MLRVSASLVSGSCLCRSRTCFISLQAAPLSLVVPSACWVSMGLVGRATSPRWGVQISWALRPVLVWKLVVRNVGSECVCDLQITLPEPNFRALCYTSGNNSPAVKFSLLFHSAPNACAPVSRCEGGGSYVSIPSLPAASSLGAELPSLAWDTLGHPPPGLGAPRSSRFAPEPGAAPGRAPRPRPGFSIGSLKITLLRSQETTWVCSCSRGLFWLYKPPSSSSRGGKAGAGKSFEAGEGFVSPAAGLDGSQNTALEEKHLLDGLERVITNLWGSPAAGGDGERMGTGAEKGVCSFCLVWLSVRLLFPFAVTGQRVPKPLSSFSCGFGSRNTRGAQPGSSLFFHRVCPAREIPREGGKCTCCWKTAGGTSARQIYRVKTLLWATVRGADRSGCWISMKLWKYRRDFN